MEEQKNKKVVKIPAWMASFAMALVVAILFVILYLQFTRYKLVEKSIELGDSTTSALLLSPEISAGLAALI